MDASVVASAALAVAWTWENTRTLERGPAADLASAAKQATWSGVMCVRTLNQVLPAGCVLLAAVTPWSAIVSACSFGVADLQPGERSWLGEGELSVWQHLAILVALTVWRAEKLESTLQRMQRSVGVIRASGVGLALSSATADPVGWVWPAFWGVARRLALVAIGSFGTAPFLLVAFPAVVFDECLWWLLAKAQDLWSRKVCSLPAAVDVVVLPLVDLVHFLPVLSRVFLLAVFHYADHGSGLLVLCALAWTAHSCHTLYTTVFVDVPDSARQLWAASSMG
mmetsp:Transcript_70863/g.220137  ORF Transcript_70863/g.220137 Transcript_70863/m.220137 type:complete len:281 (+) Transcript_70863:73-915(+)